MTDADKNRVYELAEQGMSRGQIAKETGWALTTVARICREHGMSSEVQLPRAFVEARALSIKDRQIQARERKLAIDELMDAKVLATLNGNGTWTTRVRTQGGGERWDAVDFIPIDDFRNATSSGAALASSFKSYAPLETGVDVTVAESVVDSLMDGFKTLYKNATQKDKVEGGDE
jgi:hypothetical protein